MQDVSRVYRLGLLRRRHVALADVDLAVARGLSLGLVGPNGSGKSTLLRILAGIDQPTTGTVRVFGEPPDARAVRRRIAYLPDGSPFPGELTAGRALALIGSLRGIARAEAKVLIPRMLERVGLDAHPRTPLRGYSRGMHRRFGLAQAFLGRPDLVLLDEPTAGLDAPGFHALADLLGEARSAGVTLILASHIATDLLDHCDEAVLLGDARVRRRAAPENLLGDPERTELTVRHLKAQDEGRLAAWARSELGAEVERVRPAQRSLAQLYADAKGSSAGDSGSSPGAGESSPSHGGSKS